MKILRWQWHVFLLQFKNLFPAIHTCFVGFFWGICLNFLKAGFLVQIHSLRICATCPLEDIIYHPCAANDQPPTRKRSGKAIVDLFHTPLQHGDVLKLMANAASIARLRRSYDARHRSGSQGKWKFNASKMDDKLNYCWWESCTTKDHAYPTIHRVEQPSQVVVWDFVHQQYDKLIDKYCETPRVMEDRCNLGLPEILCGHDLFEVSAAV